MEHRHTHPHEAPSGVGSALRQAFRPLFGRPAKPEEEPKPDPREAIAKMRSAASLLKEVAGVVEPTQEPDPLKDALERLSEKINGGGHN